MSTLPSPYLTQYPGSYSPGQYNTGATGSYSAAGGYNPFGGIINGNGSANIQGLYDEMGANYDEQGQQFTADQSNVVNSDFANQDSYGNLTNELYSPIWNGGGGYTQDQMNNIVQSGAQSNIASELPGNQLSESQQSAVAGDPYQAYNSYLGSDTGVNNLIGQYSTGLDQAVSGGQTNANAALAGMASGYSSAINPSQLQVSSNYAPQIQGDLSAGASQLSSAESNPNLDTTSNYLQQAGMSDQQVQQTAEEAASSVGAQYQATQDQLMQQARESGQGSPLAIAAAGSALDRASAASQQDALTNATLQAQNAQRTAAQNVQNTQLNAGQYQSGLTSSNALAEQNAGIAAATTGQQLNLSANQNLSQEQMAAAQNLGVEGVNEANTVAGNSINALNSEGNMGVSALQNEANTAAGLQQTAESTASNRAYELGANQQQTSESNEAMQNTLQNEASSQYQSAYSPWVQEQQMGLQEAPQQEEYYGSQGNTAESQNLQGTNMYMSGAENAAAGLAGRQVENQNNSFGQQFSNSVGNSLGNTAGKAAIYGNQNQAEEGKMIDHHQLIEVGEHNRPEVILPLDPRTPPGQQNPFERLGSELGDQMGIHKRGYATGGITAGNDFTNDLAGIDLAELQIPHYASGGLIAPHMNIPHTSIRLPHISTPGIRTPSVGVRLNMPIRFPRISAPIRPAGLPGISTGYTAAEAPKYKIPGYESGGVINMQATQKKRLAPERNNYTMNMGRHNYHPLPYSEMGNLTR